MADGSPRSDATLSQLLKLELEHVSDLMQTLGDEQNSIGHNDHEGLVAVIAKKQTVIDALNRVDRARAELLNAAGYTADYTGVESYIADQAEPDRQHLNKLWERLLQAVADCQQKNLVNGSIIGMNLRHCAQAVAILCGQPPRQELYDPRGNPSAIQPQGRPIKA